MTTKLEFDVLVNDKGSSKLDKLGQSFSRFGTIARTAGNTSAGAAGRMGGAIAGAAKMGVAGVAVLGAGLAATAPKVFDMAGNLELLGKKSSVVFGSELGKVEKWASTNANAMGLTKREAVGLAAGMADLLIPMGFSRKAAADMSTQVTGLAGALSEWSGGTRSAAEVSDILNAALLGERDSLQGLGISISQAQVDAQVLVNKKKGLKFATDEQAQAQATLDLVMAKSTDAQKAFATGSDTLSRKMETSKAKLKEMGQELLVKATPALTSIATHISEDVIPALVRFGGWVDDNKYKFAEAFIDMGIAVTGLVKFFGPALKTMNGFFLDFVGSVIHGAAEAFGWIPNVGPKLKAADEKFQSFATGAKTAFDKAITKADDWNESLKKMKTEVQIKGEISDLEEKLKTAKTQLADKNLTKDRKAALKATIKDLEEKLNTAHTKLDAGWITKARIAKLQANKKDLEDKLKTAKEKLADPKLTATKKATLKAEIKNLTSQVKTAQDKIDGLKGKTVKVDVKFSSLGYTLSLGAKTKQMKFATGGPVFGAGTATSDSIPALLSNNEHVWTAKEVQAAGGHGAVEKMRKAALNGYAAGGAVTLGGLYEQVINKAATQLNPGFGPYGAATAFARSQAGKPYVWGSAGPGGFDCSGFMSAITNFIRGKSPFSRVGSTGTFPWPGFARGPGAFMIGSFKGNPGHMAGTLMGMNVESRGGEGVVVGSRARGANNGLFGGNVWHLARLAAGGRVGDAPFDLLARGGKDFLGDNVIEALDRGILNRDNGGPIYPGLNLVHNGTGRNETVIPGSAGGVHIHLDGTFIGGSAAQFEDMLVKAWDDAKRKGRIR